MHTRKKGKSGSTRPMSSEPPQWSNKNAEEIENIIQKLAAQGYSSSEIGMILRDSYAVPDVSLVTGKKIVTIMKEKNVAPKLPEDIYNLMSKALNLKKHLDKNPKDVHNKRSFNNIESKIRKLVKYYKNDNVLPKDWKYSIKNAEMLITR